MITPRVRCFESALADVRYVFGGPIPFPKREPKETRDKFRARLKDLEDRRERVIEQLAALHETRRRASGSDCQSEARS